MPTVAIKGHQQHRDMVINYTVHSEKLSERAIRICISFKCALTPLALSNSNSTRKFMASSKLSIHLLGQIATGA